MLTNFYLHLHPVSIKKQGIALSYTWCMGGVTFFLFLIETVTGVLDEVWIDDDSNTRRVCERLIEKWGHKHRGRVICYGDPSGGARKSSSERSDWQTIEDYLARQWPVFEMDIHGGDPGPRDRVVVTNSRLKNASDVVRGIFETIDEAGRLIVRANDNSRIAITAGDVHFGTTASLRS